MPRKPWRSKRFDFDGPRGRPGKKPGRPYNIAELIESRADRALATAKGNWVKATDFLYKSMQLEVLRAIDASEEQKAQAVNALSLERHMLKAARLTLAGEGMEKREAAKLFKSTIELAKRAQARWQQEHGPDQSAQGMLKDIQSFEKSMDFAWQGNPKDRVLFNPPFNTIIKTGRRFAWLELEQLLGRENLDFFQSEVEKGSDTIRKIQARLEATKRMQN
jgi:hypothetical protein